MLEVVSAGGLAIDGRDILLVRHVATNDDQKLGFAKGHVDPGETPPQAACREFFEETRRPGQIVGYLGSTIRDSVEYDDHKQPIGPSRKTIFMFLMAHTAEVDQLYERHTRPVWCNIDRLLAGDDPHLQMRHPEEFAFVQDVVLPRVNVAPPKYEAA